MRVQVPLGAPNFKTMKTVPINELSSKEKDEALSASRTLLKDFEKIIEENPDLFSDLGKERALKLLYKVFSYVPPNSED